MPKDPPATESATASPIDRAGISLAVTLGLIALGTAPMFGGGYSGAGYQVTLVLLPLAAALAWANARQRPVAATLVALACLLSGVLLPLWINPGRLLWFYLLGIPAAWLVTWAGLRDAPERARFLLPVMTGGALITALYSGWLWLGSGRWDYQFVGTFGLKNAYAGFLLLAWPLAAVGLVLAGPTFWRWLYSVAVVLLGLALVLTYSRAAWIAFVLQVIGLGVYLIWRRRGQQPQLERGLVMAGSVLAAAICLLLTLPLMRQVAGRVFDFHGYSMQGRLRFWTAALEIFRDHPWTGVGLGNFAYFYPQYQRDYVYYSTDPHAWPLQLLCELGLPGLLLLIVLVLGAGLWIRRIWRGTQAAPAGALLIAALLGSLLHAAVDFDYTFSATTAWLGVILAYGAQLATPAVTEPLPPLRWQRWAAGAVCVLLLGAAFCGEALTSERYTLDRLREVPLTNMVGRQELLEQALRYNRWNFQTHHQLASLLAQPGQGKRDEALMHLERCLKLNPRYPQALVLKGLLSRPLASGAPLVEQALQLDPYNFPDHYFMYATMAREDATIRERLLLGLERIPITSPITPEHVRPTWYELNPLWAKWYAELARLTEDPQKAAEYRNRSANFSAYWQNVLKERGQANPAPADSAGAAAPPPSST